MDPAMESAEQSGSQAGIELKTGLTAQQLAYRFIRARIIDGVYTGGMSLKPNRIAEELGISRMPVREALRQLDVEGLITLRQNRTAVVTELTISEINDLFEMRAALEGLAATSVVPHLTDAALDALEALRASMNAAEDDVQEWMRRHAKFHDYLSLLCGRRRLIEEVGRLRAAVQPYLLIYNNVYRSFELPGHEHATLLTALRTRNASLIDICLREHVLSAGRGVVAFLAQRQSDRAKQPKSARRSRRAA
jgi:DNA-binding GntR family transcriptional regulator